MFDYLFCLYFLIELELFGRHRLCELYLLLGDLDHQNRYKINFFLDNGISATAISPSGASTGAFEAFELRDLNKDKFLGKSVYKAVENINNNIAPKIKNLNPNEQKKNRPNSH